MTSIDPSLAQPPRTVREAFGADHVRLERLFTDLEAAFAADVPHEHQRLWSELDRRLQAHMELEERVMLPRLAATHPAESEALRREHDELRSLLLDLGVGVDLHTTRAVAVGRFTELLRAHARREDALLYRWADETLGRDVQNELQGRLVGLAARID